MWGSSGNVIGGYSDPWLIGRRAARNQRSASVAPRGHSHDQRYRHAERARSDAARLHPQRRRRWGTCTTLNFYMDMIPLQDREEWLTSYAVAATGRCGWLSSARPVTPTFHRDATGFGPAIQSEPLYTESSPSTKGHAAFSNEPGRLSRPHCRHVGSRQDELQQRLALRQLVAI